MDQIHENKIFKMRCLIRNLISVHLHLVLTSVKSNILEISFLFTLVSLFSLYGFLIKFKCLLIHQSEKVEHYNAFLFHSLEHSTWYCLSSHKDKIFNRFPSAYCLFIWIACRIYHIHQCLLVTYWTSNCWSIIHTIADLTKHRVQKFSLSISNEYIFYIDSRSHRRQFPYHLSIWHVDMLLS